MWFHKFSNGSPKSATTPESKQYLFQWRERKQLSLVITDSSINLHTKSYNDIQKAVMLSKCYLPMKCLSILHLDTISYTDLIYCLHLMNSKKIRFKYVGVFEIMLNNQPNKIRTKYMRLLETHCLLQYIFFSLFMEFKFYCLKVKNVFFLLRFALHAQLFQNDLFKSHS